MNNTIKKFLEESPIADKIKLKGRVVVNRTKLSAGSLAEIYSEKIYNPSEKDDTCELEFGGSVLASGKIVKKKGEYYFKVDSIIENKEA
jgi:hypothetical protein